MKFDVTVERLASDGTASQAVMIVEAPWAEAILHTPTNPCSLTIAWADGVILAVTPSTSTDPATVTLDAMGRPV